MMFGNSIMGIVSYSWGGGQLESFGGHLPPCAPLGLNPNSGRYWGGGRGGGVFHSSMETPFWTSYVLYICLYSMHMIMTCENPLCLLS